MEQLDAKLKLRLNDDAKIDLSLLYAYVKTRQSKASIHPYDLLYPINALRNLALRQCKSNYAFSLDVDFSMSHKAKDIIADHMHLLQKSKSPLALVVPVFEWIFEKEVMPSEFDMKELRQYCSTGRLIPFHSKKMSRISYSKHDLKDWCYGNSSEPKHLKITRVQNLTDYTKWLSSSDVYQVRKKANVLDPYYEPYFIAQKDLIPEFSERFRGCTLIYNSNLKMDLIKELMQWQCNTQDLILWFFQRPLQYIDTIVIQIGAHNLNTIF